jgi:hypothetical protein
MATPVTIRVTILSSNQIEFSYLCSKKLSTSMLLVCEPNLFLKSADTLGPLFCISLPKIVLGFYNSATLSLKSQ